MSLLAIREGRIAGSGRYPKGNSKMRTDLSALSMVLCLCFSVGAKAQGSARLWLVDDVQKQVHELRPNGQLLSSFPTQAGATSSIAVDPSDDTLWGASEGTDRIVNFDKSGQLISFFFTSTFDPNAVQPEGVDVNPTDDTLWIVDDVTLLVYNVHKDGTLISSFPTSSYDPLAGSPQDLAYDVFDGTLWLTDNVTDSIYHVSKTGQLISSFPVSAFDPSIANPQGISSPPNRAGVLWVTARDTAKIYEITTTGVLLSSRSTVPYGSNDPTGVLLDLGPSALSYFCTAKTTLSCGTPSISAVGAPSATAAAGFTISAAPAAACRAGFLLYSNGAIQAGIPFGGAGDGVLCLGLPAREAGLIDSGGSPGACNGAFSIDMNAFALSQYTPSGCLPPSFVTPPAGFLTTPGVSVNTQMLGKDSHATGRLLSAGLTFVVGP